VTLHKSNALLKPIMLLPGLQLSVWKFPKVSMSTEVMVGLSALPFAKQLNPPPVEFALNVNAPNSVPDVGEVQFGGTATPMSGSVVAFARSGITETSNRKETIIRNRLIVYLRLV
jgi:hypothetical protein